MKKGKTRNAKSNNDELDLSHLNETVEETERRRDAEANLAALHGRSAASPDFDAPFAPGLGSAGVIPNNEDGDYRDSGNALRIDLGDGSIEGMSDLNDVSGNPQVYNGPMTSESIADLSEGGLGGMTIEHINDIEHGTGGLPEEIKEHEAKRTAQRVHFKKAEGNPLLEPARRMPEDQKDKQRAAKRGTGGAVRSGATGQTSNTRIAKSETTGDTRRGVGTRKNSENGLQSKNTSKPSARNARVGKKALQKSSGKKASAKTSLKKTSAKSAVKKGSSKKSAAKKSVVKKSASKKAGTKKVASRKTGSTKSNRTMTKSKKSKRSR